jgi:hypothetical protein
MDQLNASFVMTVGQQEKLERVGESSARVDDRKIMNAIFYVLRTGFHSGIFGMLRPLHGGLYQLPLIRTRAPIGAIRWT